MHDPVSTPALSYCDIDVTRERLFLDGLLRFVSKLTSVDLIVQVSSMMRSSVVSSVIQYCQTTTFYGKQTALYIAVLTFWRDVFLTTP